MGVGPIFFSDTATAERSIRFPIPFFPTQAQHPICKTPVMIYDLSLRQTALSARAETPDAS
jgi:hypothetical protein